MKHILPLFWGVAIYLSSCAPTYQYLSFSGSPIDTIQNPTKIGVENEIFSVEYKLYRHNNILSVIVKNKSEGDLYLNWKKTSLTVGGIKRDEFSFPEMIFIPPGSSVERGVFEYPAILFFANLANSPATNHILIDSDQYRRKFKRYLFTQQNSPLQLKHYLYLSLDQLGLDEINVNSEFYIKEVIETKYSRFLESKYPSRTPKLTPPLDFSENNKFVLYNYTPGTGAETASSVMGLIGVTLEIMSGFQKD